MIGALKCCGTGARMLRSASSTTSSVTSTLDSCHFGNLPCTLVDNQKSLSGLNWSQKRFLRGQATSSSGDEDSVNGNAGFVVKVIEGQMRGKGTKDNVNNQAESLRRVKERNKYSRSVRGHQSQMLTSLNVNADNKVVDLIAEIAKLVVEEGSPVVRVKNRKEEALLLEWIGIQNELRVVKRDKIEDYKRKLQIASEQALQEMEANLTKANSLEDLDQAIEGALCSEAKREFSQKSWNDN